MSSPLPDPAGTRDALPPPDTAATLGDGVGGGPPLVPPGYQLLAELGRGAMGVVYRARNLALDREVALKVILSGAHAAPDEVARFAAEARALARLQHPGI